MKLFKIFSSEIKQFSRPVFGKELLSNAIKNDMRNLLKVYQVKITKVTKLIMLIKFFTFCCF